MLSQSCLQLQNQVYQMDLTSELMIETGMND